MGSEQKACRSKDNKIKVVTASLKEALDEHKEDQSMILSLEYGSAGAEAVEAERQLSQANRSYASEELHLEELSRLKVSLAASEDECRQQTLVINRLKETDLKDK